MFNLKKRLQDRRSKKRDDCHQKHQPGSSNEQDPDHDPDAVQKKIPPEPDGYFKSKLPVRYYIPSNSS